MKQFQINFWYSCQRLWLHKLGVRKIQKRFITPWKSFNKVTDISIDFLLKNNISTIILDMDGTVKHYKNGVEKDILEWVKNVKKVINLYLVSNSNKELTSKVADILEVKYIYSAGKPFKKAFIKILKYVNDDISNIAIIGDSLIADIKGAKKVGIEKTILVEDLNEYK